ncbi:hypothetical protein CHS0354_001559 [Potamilus streckersoni]|uniref:ATP-dependent DNA helicase n=1 Tax=Potamilus streckersoni TaxID=2493646 RepID=A0AAE0SLI1_9BIVA|nr:hypothetical protein CHS0354_001559 [Potamilus streckersoni]
MLTYDGVLIIMLLILARVFMMEGILHTATSGHTIIILGQAGTGKSFLANNLSKRLKEIGKTVCLIASRGIAANQLHGMIIHKISSIQDCHFPNYILIDKIRNDDDDMIDIIRIMNVDTHFINEIFMLSLELFLQIEKVFRTVKENNFPFCGIWSLLLVNSFNGSLCQMMCTMRKENSLSLMSRFTA